MMESHCHFSVIVQQCSYKVQIQGTNTDHSTELEKCSKLSQLIVFFIKQRGPKLQTLLVKKMIEFDNI